MTRRFIYIIFIFSIILECNPVFSQRLLGNEWIVYGNTYLKISIDKPGIYRINKSELNQNGIETDIINPKNLKLFFRGKELAIYISGENDNKFDQNDYIEFFAINNDGQQDTLVYRPASSRPNKFLSIYSQKTAYFLTIDNSSFGKRIIQQNPFEENILPEEYYFKKITKVFDEDWNYDISTGGIPPLAQSYFEPNETLVSIPFRFQGERSEFVENIGMDNYLLTSNKPVYFESMICSRYDAKKIISYSLPERSINVPLDSYKLAQINETVNSLKSDIFPIKIKIESSNSNNVLDGKKYDIFSILYYHLKYPRKPIYIENNEYELDTNLSGKSILKLSKGNDKIFAYNITDIYNQKKLATEFVENNISIFVNNTNVTQKIWLNSKPLTPFSIQKIDFKSRDLSKTDFIIITDTSLIDGANKYKLYRESVNGGKNKVVIGEKSSLFDEYTYGERNPVALKRFVENISSLGKPKYLLLLGKARSTPSLFKTNELDDITPTFGYPASDALLSAGLNGNNPDIQTLATGRIAALKNEHITDYLDKVIEYEANLKDTNWKKNILHLGGGRGEAQINEFKSFLKQLGDISKSSKLGSEYSMLNKTNALIGTENIDISQKINDGIGIVTFFGHSSSLALDLNIGYVSDPKANFKNSPNYPFMFFNGCAAGNVFQKPQSLTNDWIITPQKGAIAVLAHSFLSYSNTNTTYMEKLYKTWFSSVEMLNKPIGEVVLKVNEELINSNKNDIYMIANTQQMILQGDPSIRIFNFDKPDFEINDDKLFLLTKYKNKNIPEGDSLSLGLIVTNKGIYEKGTAFNINLKKVYSDGKSENNIYKINSVANTDTLIISLKKDLNLKSIEINLDNDFKINEISETNNFGKINFDWDLLKNREYFTTAIFADKTNPILSVKFDGNSLFDGIEVFQNSMFDISLIDDNSFGNKIDKLEVYLKRICDNCPDFRKKLDISNIKGDSNEILAKVFLGVLETGNYQLFVQGFDANKNSSGEVYTLNFSVLSENDDVKLKVYPNPAQIFTNFEIDFNQKQNSTNNKYELFIFDLQGKLINSKLGNIIFGKNNIFWDGKNKNFETISTGNYIYKLNIISNTKTLKFDGKIILTN